MGSILYDFLNDSPLSEEGLIASRYAKFSDKELKRLLSDYRSYCFSHSAELLEEVPSTREGANLFFSELPTLDLLKRTLLYVPCHVVADPLLRHSRRHGHVLGPVLMETAGFEEGTVDREKLAQDVLFMRAVRPMVAKNYLKFVPAIDLGQSTPSAEILYSDSLFADALPPAVLELMKSRALVRSVMIGDGAGYVKPVLEPSRAISIVFEGARSDRGYGYTLHQQRVVNVDEANKQLKVELSLPLDPPSLSQFEKWVEQSVNQAARDFVGQQIRSCQLAASCGANLCVEDSLGFDILQSFEPAAQNPRTATTNSLLNFELPFVEEVSLDRMVMVRSDEGPVFQQFRSSLEVALGARRSTEPSGIPDATQDGALVKLFEHEVSACRRQMTDLRRQGVLAGAIGALSLMAVAVQPHSSVFLAAIGALQGFKTYDEYRAASRTLPGYFLWRMLDKRE